MMNKTKGFVSAALVALLALCSSMTTTQAQTKPTTKVVPAPLVLTEAYDGKTVTVEQGRAVRIDVEGKLSTGASWTVTGTTGGAVTQNGKVTTAQKKATPGGPPVLGASETFSARFDAVKQGTSKVSMEYKRPWDKGGPWKTFTVTIKVVPIGSLKP